MIRIIIFLLILSSTSSHAQRKSLPNLKFDSKSISYTSIKYQQKDPHKVKAKFVFTNVGSSPIQILEVKPSCSCTTPDFSKEFIKPKQKGFIVLQTTADQLKNNGLVYAVVKTNSNTDTYIKLVLNY